MASVSLKDVLGAPQLCGSFETVKTGIPDVYPPEYYNVDNNVEGDKGSYFQVQGQRQLAEIASYGSSSTTTQMKGVTEVPVILLHVVKNLTLPMTKFMGLIRKDSAGSNLLIDEKGVQEISRHIKNSVQLVRNLKIALLTQLLTLGNNYFDAQGRMLPSSSGAKTTAPSGIAAANIGNLTSVLSGSTAWTNPAADIADQLVQLDQLSMDNSGYDLEYAFYGRNIPKYLSGNPKMAAYLARNTGANDLYIRKGRITELGNLSWMPGYRSSFRTQNSDGTETTNRLIGDDEIVFTPAPSSSWLGWINGSYPVPKTIDVARDGMEVLSNVDVVYGDFMYAQVMTDPVSIKLVYGTTTLPTVKVPSAPFKINVSA